MMENQILKNKKKKRLTSERAGLCCVCVCVP